MADRLNCKDGQWRPMKIVLKRFNDVRAGKASLTDVGNAQICLVLSFESRVNWKVMLLGVLRRNSQVAPHLGGLEERQDVSGRKLSVA